MNSRTFVFIVGWLVFGCGVNQGQPVTGHSNNLWELVFADEFDGASLNSQVWTPELGTGESRGIVGWGNNELQYYTARTENLSVDDGTLKITATAESYEGSAYTSARIVTQDLVSTQYGRIEARMKLPAGQGLWPAFWLLGSNFSEVSWPECGEIDVMEFRGQDPAVVHGTVHGPGYSGGASIGGSYILEDGGTFSDSFHVFGVDWDSEVISFWVDGVHYFKIRRSQLTPDQPWVFDQPFFLLLNLAVGGNYVGPPDSETLFPAVLEVDYVRLYRRN